MRDAIMRDEDASEREVLRGHASINPRQRLGVAPLRCEPGELLEVVDMARAGAGSVWVRANSRSMAPTIGVGADIRLDPPGELRVGSVVLARLPNGLVVLHRVYRIDGDRIVLRGDAHGRPDPAITRADVVASAEVMSIAGSERLIGPRPVVSIPDVKRWLRLLTSRLRRMSRLLQAARSVA